MDSEKNLAHAQPSIPEELVELKVWWKKYGDHISTGLIVILAAFVAHRYYERHISSKDSTVAIAYARAMSVEDFESILSSHKRSAYAPLAQLRLANEYYHQKRYDLALETYDAFQKAHPTHLFVGIAVLGKANTLEAQGEFVQADALYTDFAAQNATHYLTPLAILGTARCALWQGREIEARAILDRLLADRAGTVWSASADELKSALPRLTFIAPESAADADFLRGMDMFQNLDVLQ